MKNKKRMDNNGFSLVELIIVIAIMAVLIGVLAPQYLKYVERGRESADLDNIDIMVSAVEIYNADPAYTPVSGKITGGAPVTAEADILKALKEAGIENLPSMKSKEYNSGWVITFGADGWDVTTNSPNNKLKTALGR